MSATVKSESLQPHANDAPSTLPSQSSVPSMEPINVHQCGAEVTALREEVDTLKTGLAQLRDELKELKDSTASLVALAEKVLNSLVAQAMPPTKATPTIANPYSDAIPIPWAPAEYDMETEHTKEPSNDKGKSSKFVEPTPLSQHTSSLGSLPIPTNAQNTLRQIVEAQYPEEHEYIALAEILHWCNKRPNSEMSDKDLRYYMNVYAKRAFEGLAGIKAYCEAASRVCEIEMKHTKKAFHIRLKDRMKPFKSAASNTIFFVERDFTTLQMIHAEYKEALAKERKLKVQIRLAKKAADQKAKVG